MKKYLIPILIIAVQIFCLTLIYTWIQNEEAELQGKYDAGYEAGIFFNLKEIENCQGILDYLGIKKQVMIN